LSEPETKSSASAGATEAASAVTGGPETMLGRKGMSAMVPSGVFSTASRTASAPPSSERPSATAPGMRGTPLQRFRMTLPRPRTANSSAEGSGGGALPTDSSCLFMFSSTSASLAAVCASRSASSGVCPGVAAGSGVASAVGEGDGLSGLTAGTSEMVGATTAISVREGSAGCACALSRSSDVVCIWSAQACCATFVST
jgi:hypothetical protein